MSTIESFLVAIILFGLVLFPVALLFSDPLGIIIFLYLIATVPIILLSTLAIYFIRRKKTSTEVTPPKTTRLVRIIKIAVLAGALVLTTIFMGLWAIVMTGV